MKKWFKKTLFFFLALVLVLFAFYRLWFLRQPDRKIPDDAGIFVSPANGTVVAVEAWDSTLLEWEKDEGVVQVSTNEIATMGYLVAIEMNVMNVHYQRAPTDGKLLHEKYTAGKFNNAIVKVNRYGLRLENERNSLLFETENGIRYKVVQVAGLLARRIEDFVEPGQQVKRGEVIGVIKLGSQVALVLPKAVNIQVKPGDMVVDGETIIAKLEVQ